MKHMKRAADILSGFVLFMVIQFFLNALFSAPYDTHRDFIEIGCARNIPGQLWIDNPRDDNPVEIKDQIEPESIGEPPGNSSLRTIITRPVRQSLLNPLFVDRPPPSLCI